MGTEMSVSKLDDAPVGLLPDSTLTAAYGLSRNTVPDYRESKGIPRYSMLNNPRFPSKAGSFGKIIRAWGVERSREWLAKYAPHFLPYFELDAMGPSAAATRERRKLIGNSVRGAETITYPVLFLSSEAKDEDSLEDKAAERRRIQEEMSKFLASGKVQTVGRPAGWADKGAAGKVGVRSSVGSRARAG
jgi:hypothetical protein